MKKIIHCFAAGVLLLLTSCGGGAGPSGHPSGPLPGSGSLTQINHIVWTVQEFRSFDNYFGKLNDYRLSKGLPADADGLPADAGNPSMDRAAQVPAYHLSTVCIENLSPAWNESRNDVNRLNPDLKTGPMDGFVWVAGHFALDSNAAGQGPYNDVQGLRTMGYYTEREIPYYYFMATQFAISDRFFGTILSRTPPNRIANMAASALGVVDTIPTGKTFSQNTIFHLLQSAGISWKVYASTSTGTYMGYFEPFFSEHQDRIVLVDQYFADLENNTLPQVAFIEPDDPTNEHPGKNLQVGVAYMAKLMNALMQSQSWRDSVFLLTYDHGGLYDHVPPQPAVAPDDIPPELAPEHIVDDYSRTGFRVPLVVVSPFARKGYISHTVMDRTAILKLIETRFQLPHLTARDAAQPDMTEFFDFTNVPNATPPSPPAQPTDGPCNDSLP